MTYDLAKELKDAGFPQRGRLFISPDGSTYDWMELKTGGVALPTLSELIEACGPDFWYLRRNTDGTWMVAGDAILSIYNYASPAQAVARLWLALNTSGALDKTGAGGGIA